jgi:hypothetical protein
MMKNVEINSSTQVINIGNEKIFFTLSNKLIKKTRVIDGFI